MCIHVNAASSVLRAAHSVEDHHGLLLDSPLSKKTCARQVMIIVSHINENSNVNTSSNNTGHNNNDNRVRQYYIMDKVIYIKQLLQLLVKQ